MSILTKPSNPLSAAVEYGFELSISELLQLVQSVTNSDYWGDISNWREVDFVYVNAQKQYQRVVFDLVSNEVNVNYSFNENCINGLFECGRITVFGYVNDSLRIKRPAYGAEFDVIIVDGIELGTSIVINSVTPPMFGTYVENDVLTFTLNFSDLVNITGLSLLNEDGTLVLLEDEYALLLEDTRLAILVGSEIRYATYVSGSESANVVYEYVVQAGDQDLDGIEILSLDLNGGVIIGVNGESVNITIPTTDTSGVLIDNSEPDTTAPTILDIVVADGIYEEGDNIIFRVYISDMNLGLSIGGNPYLRINIGGVETQAYIAFTSLNHIGFVYTVQPGDTDTDGIEILSLDGGSISDPASNLLDRTLPDVDTSGVIVSTVAPDIIAPTITDILVSDGIYEDQDNIIFTVEFSENVLVSGSPVLTLDIGGVTRQAALLSSSLNQAVFSYTVEQPDNDNNGIEIVSLDNGVITDAALNFLDRTLPVVDTSNVFVSTVAPDTTAPTILSITALNGTYKAGDNLNFTATFSEPVVITGTPYLLVDIGGTQVQANMTSSNSADATFSYTVLAGQLDLNGVQVLSLNSAVITDNALNLLDRTLPSMDMSLVKVDAVPPVINSITPPSNGYYNSGDQLNFIVNYSENVIVDNSLGAPYITLTIGSTPVQASYLSGSGSSQLLFRYTIQNGDNDSNGVALSSPIFLNGGTIKDAALNDATLTFTLPNTTGIIVDTIAPTITARNAPTDGIYSTGQTLTYTFNFSETVVVTGTPTVNVVIGSSTKTFQYISGSNSNTLSFSYTVLSGDDDADGIQLDSPILLPGVATIRDLAGNNADLTFTLLSSPNVIVDTLSPRITSISSPSSGRYNEGDQLDFTFIFSEPVTVTGTPNFIITVGTINASATYVSGSGSSQLLFRYTVLAGQNDSNGIFLNSPILKPSGATIKNISLTRNAILSFTSPNTTGIIIDTTIPTITSFFTSPTAKTYLVGEVITFTAGFNEVVNVTGVPFLQVLFGSSTKQFNYTSGSASTTLTFSYTVQSGDLDEDGISFASTSIQLPPSATIRDLAGNNANLSFTPPNTTQIFVDNSFMYTNKTTANGLGNNNVNSVYVDSLGKIYAGTSGGLSISTDGGTSFTNKTMSSGLGSNDVREVYVDNSGKIYAATTSGLSISTDGGTTFNTRTVINSGLPSSLLSGFYVDSLGNIYVVANSPARLAISTDGGTSFNPAKSVPGTLVDDVYVDNSGKIYVGTSNGLATTTDGGNSFSNQLVGQSIYKIHIDGSSNLYAGGNAGLNILTAGSTTFNTRTVINSGLADNNVLSVHTTSNSSKICTGGPSTHTLNISTNGGTSFTRRTTANGLGSSVVNDVFVDESGKVYAATQNGLSISN